MQSKIDNMLGSEYSLIDSGNFQKLEEFAGKVLARPSSLCLWKKSLKIDVWKKADAWYDPKKGWQFKSEHFSDWIMKCRGFKLKLRLQTNGQVGIFPEHALYLTYLDKFLNDKQPCGLKAINLFAYSGMASMYLLKKGLEVCHVDSSKKAIEWAKENSSLNEVPNGRLRLIADDALAFIKREGRRGSKYDVVILDPPSFSRLDSKKTWKLEDVLYEFTEGAALILNAGGMLIFSCHHHALDSRILMNVFQESGLEVVNSSDLYLRGDNNGKMLPSGSNITLVSN